jgi:hypothetical protein
MLRSVPPRIARVWQVRLISSLPRFSQGFCGYPPMQEPRMMDLTVALVGPYGMLLGEWSSAIGVHS